MTPKIDQKPPVAYFQREETASTDNSIQARTAIQGTQILNPEEQKKIDKCLHRLLGVKYCGNKQSAAGIPLFQYDLKKKELFITEEGMQAIIQQVISTPTNQPGNFSRCPTRLHTKGITHFIHSLWTIPAHNLIFKFCLTHDEVDTLAKICTKNNFPPPKLEHEASRKKFDERLAHYKIMMQERFLDFIILCK